MERGEKMKKLITVLLVCSLAGFASAQNVLDVPALDGEGNLIVNALIQFVVADTNADGEQLHDAYRLERGKTYLYNQSPVFKNPITLFADPPGDTDDTKPPKIMLTTDDQGAAPYEHCITTFADLTVKNIAFSSMTADYGYSWANAILLQADGLTIHLEGCHFTLTGWGMIEANVNNTTFVFDKCHVRNGTVCGSGDEWCPFFFEINTGSAESLIVRNSTFFNLQGSVINIETQNLIKELIFDHNTLVNVVKGFSSAIHAHTNSTVTNNIFYNVAPHSQLNEQIADIEDAVQNSVINADTLVSNLPNAPPEMTFYMAEEDRTFHLKNNAYFWTQDVKDYWADYAAADLAPQVWMNTRAQAMFDDDVGYPNFVAENNVEIDPNFTNFGGTEAMVANMRAHRDGGAFGFWGWDPDSVDFPNLHWAILQWPLPEDFSYTADIPSTDGYHVGSLMYYPTELAQYEAGLTGIGDEKVATIPHRFTLDQNYPNPFNPTTNIRFKLDTAGKVSLKIYNVSGQLVKTVVDQTKIQAGVHTYQVNMSDLSNGVYFYQLQKGSETLTKKLTLMK